MTTTVIDRRHHRARLEIHPDRVVKTYHDPFEAQWELAWYVTVGGRYAPPLLESSRGRLVIGRGEPVTDPMPHELFTLLTELESQGIHHRDVWAGNLVLVSGELRLIDWETAVYGDTPSYDLYGPEISGIAPPAIHLVLRSYRMWWDADHPKSIRSMWGVRVSDLAGR